MPMSSYYEINYTAFETLSRMFEHDEIKRNLIKLRALKDSLNKEQSAKDAKKGKK